MVSASRNKKKTLSISARIFIKRRSMCKVNIPWGIKDPRMLFCIKAWHKPSDYFVGTFRHPSAVVMSLKKRNKMSLNPIAFHDWERLWFHYNRRLVNLYKHHPFPIINFDWSEERYLYAIKRIARRFEVSGIKQEFFSKALIHHRPNKVFYMEEHKRIYEELIDISLIEEKKLIKE